MNKYAFPVIVMLFVVTTGVYFYWSQWRPTNIKKTCAEAVKRGSYEDLISEFGFASGSNFSDDIYKQCSRLKGL